MFALYRASKFAAAIFAATMLLAAVPSKSYAETGTVRLTISKAGLLASPSSRSTWTVRPEVEAGS